MFTRTPTLGSVTYKGQRALVVAALTASSSQVPDRFTLEQVVAAIDPAEYQKTFKHGKQVVTIPESVNVHLRELVKLGQIQHAPPRDDEAVVTQVETPEQEPKVVEPSDLLTKWAQWHPTGLPFVLDADREQLENNTKNMVTFASWHEATSDPEFSRPGDTRLHCGLLPQPFIGDLRSASIYILSLNPGVDPTDYFGEYEVPEYRNALMATLKQDFQNALPFVFLDPRYSWHGGFRYWHGKLAQVIKTFADESEVSFGSARVTLASQLASIEMLPYHSSKFRDAGGWLNKLRSVSLAKSYVRHFVLPRVERREAIAIVLRKVVIWGLPEMPGVVLYQGKHAQGAQLNPGSPGGQAILAQLRKKRDSKDEGLN